MYSDEDIGGWGGGARPTPTHPTPVPMVMMIYNNNYEMHKRTSLTGFSNRRILGRDGQGILARYVFK